MNTAVDLKEMYIRALKAFKHKKPALDQVYNDLTKALMRKEISKTDYEYVRQFGKSISS